MFDRLKTALRIVFIGIPLAFLYIPSGYFAIGFGRLIRLVSADFGDQNITAGENAVGIGKKWVTP